MGHKKSQSQNNLTVVAQDYINSDELVEVTPKSIRLRKKILNTELRKKFDAKKNG